MKLFSTAGWERMLYFLPKDIDRQLNDDALKFSRGGKVHDAQAIDINNLNEQQKIEYLNYGNIISNIATTQGVSAISAFRVNFDYVFKYVAPQLSPSMRYCTFAIPNLPSISDPNFKNKIEKMNIVQDKRFTTILISPDSLFGISL